MFAPLRTEVEARFAAAKLFLKTAHGTKYNTPQAQIAKGLAFVQIYAAYEYAICSAFQTAIDMLVSHRHPAKKLSPCLMTLFLHPQLQSVEDSHSWKSRLTLFEAAFSNVVPVIANSVFPSLPEKNYSGKHLQMIFKVLGIRRIPAPRLRHLHKIDEVVQNRHAVAHGRETAEIVGGRYSLADVLDAMRQTRSVCLLFINTVEKHCNDPSQHCR